MQRPLSTILLITLVCIAFTGALFPSIAKRPEETDFVTNTVTKTLTILKTETLRFTSTTSTTITLPVPMSYLIGSMTTSTVTTTITLTYTTTKTVLQTTATDTTLTSTTPNATATITPTTATSTATQTETTSNHTTLTSETATFGSLHLAVSTEKSSYRAGEEVEVSGYVVDLFGKPVPGATISIEVLGPLGKTICTASFKTRGDGRYEGEFDLEENVSAGTYTIYATASKPGYQESRAHTVFTVGESTTPSILILSINVTDVNGNAKARFRPGETITIWVVVHNAGAEIPMGIIWVEIYSSRGHPLTIQFQVTTLKRGDTAKAGFSIVLPADAPPGTYGAEGYVSDKMISKGGKFHANKRTTFAV